MLTDQQKLLAGFNAQMAPAHHGLAVPPQAQALMLDANPAEVASYRQEAESAVLATAARLIANAGLAEALDYWPADGERVMFVGDSVTTYLRSYARIIAAMLDLRCRDHRVTFLNVAQPGHTSVHALECAYTQFGSQRPDWLFIMLGLNDAKLLGAQTPLVKVETYARNLELLLDAFDAPRAVLLAPTPVVASIAAASPGFRTVGLAWDNQVVQRYGTAMAKLAVSRKASYINLFDLFGPDPDPADYLADGLHPGPRGHEKIAVRILRSMGEIV